MTVYRTHLEDIEAAPALRRLGGRVVHLLAMPRPDFDAVTQTLIDAGDLASAVLDELHPHADDLHPAAALWTAPVTSLARASDAAWHADAQGCEAALQTALCAVDACARSYVPREVTRRVSDELRDFAPSPELYAEAARAWDEARQSEPVVCVGVRPVGVSLAAAAAAGLTSRGIDASMITVRPRGTAADMSVVLTPRLQRAIQTWLDVTFLVVDEDPAGSSIACVASALSALGVDDHRIVLMPGLRLTEGELNASARPRWARHAIVASDFEPAWVASGRLASSFVAEGGMAG